MAHLMEGYFTSQTLPSDIKKKKKIENFPCLALQQMTQITQPHAFSLRWSMRHDDEAQRCHRKNNTVQISAFPLSDQCIWISYIISQGLIHPICKMLITFPNSSNCSEHGVSGFICGKYTCYFFSNNVIICKITITLGDASYLTKPSFFLTNIIAVIGLDDL